MLPAPVQPPTQAALITEAENLSNGVSVALADQPLAFLQAVWEPLAATSLVALAAEVCYHRAGTWQDTVSMDWAWLGDVRTGAYALDWAREHNRATYPLAGRGGIFWHGAARKVDVLGRHGARGTLDELTATASLWADLDCEKRGYTLAQGMDVLLAMPLKPSAIVFSGGGLQAVHLLSEPWTLTNREAAKEFKAYSLAFYGTPFRQAEIALDESVHDATRMMRLPGFVNRKPSRNGAVARLVWWRPDLRYSIAQIKKYAPLPEVSPRTEIILPANPLPRGENGETFYRVTREFVAYLVESETPTERHPALVRLSMQAARAGMPVEEFLTRLRLAVRGWFGKGEEHRVGGELENLVRWSYEQIATDPDATPVGSFVVTLAESGFELGSLDVLELASTPTVVVSTDAITTLPVTAPTQPNQLNQTNHRVGKPTTYDRDTLRQIQAAYIAEYIRAVIRGFGSYLLLRTSPGAGKSHQTWQALQKFALNWREEHAEERGGAAFLSLFKFDEHAWPKYVQGFGVDPAHVFYLVGRNGDPVSAGYCALHAQAEAVGRKGWIVKQTLCSRCPAKLQCEESWYLSQFNRAKRAPILLARHGHGLIDDIIELRKTICFDESPLAEVSAPIVLGVEDLVLPQGAVLLEDQYPAEMAILDNFVAALRRLVAGNPRPAGKERLDEKFLVLGGRGIFERLQRELSSCAIPVSLEAVLNLPEKFIKDATRAGLRDTTPEAVADLTVNFLYATWRILRYEHFTYFKAGAKRWNSRLILAGSQFLIYPMQPFTFAQNVKVIITDATGNPAHYGKAFAYPKTLDGVPGLRPRLGNVFEEQLTPLARVTQFTGTDNTRSTVRRRRKIKDASKDIQTATGEIIRHEQELDSVALEQAKIMITALAERHNGSLLVVTYKAEAQLLRTWLGSKVADTAPLNPEYIQWFGGLRGKNDYQHLEAVLVIGTPRIPPVEVMVQAQIWHWQDELPVDFTPALRLEPYPGNVSRAYQYRGYADDRVNALYADMIRAEIRQCYERIRPNSSDSARYVYLGTAFPASDHVDEYQSWVTWQIDNATEHEFETATAEGSYLAKAACVKLVSTRLGVSENAARESFERIFERWRDRIADSAYRFFDAAMRTDVISFGAVPKHSTKTDRVVAWLLAEPSRLNLSLSEMQAALKEVGVIASRTSISLARRTLIRSQALVKDINPNQAHRMQ